MDIAFIAFQHYSSTGRLMKQNIRYFKQEKSKIDEVIVVILALKTLIRNKCKSGLLVFSGSKFQGKNEI